jgi:hypothetical protein
MNTLTPDSGISPQSGKLDFEPVANQGFRSAEIALSGNRRSFAFQQINEATIKITDGRGTNAWSGNRGGGFRTTRAVAWLMGDRRRLMGLPLSQQGVTANAATGGAAIRCRDDKGHSSRQESRRSDSPSSQAAS